MEQHSQTIALFMPDLRMGGAERVMVQLAAAFSDRGFPVDFILIRQQGELMAELPSAVHIVPLKASSEYTCLPALVRYLRHAQPSVLLTTMVVSNWITLLADRLSGTRVRTVLRAATTLSALGRQSVLKKRLEHLLVRLFYPLADAIVAVSSGAADDLASYAGLDPDRIRIIPNPVLSPQLNLLAGQPLDHPWFAPGMPPVVLATGRLAQEKDYTTLIQAFSKVLAVRPAHLVILGEGEERKLLEGQVRKLALESAVNLPGFQINPYSWMRRAAVFVLSSRLEGLPNALIQAMACGCPVVATDCPSGPREILDGGRYGHLVPMGDAEALAKAILLCLDGDRRLPPPEWLQPFQQERVVDQYLDVFFPKRIPNR